VCRDERLLLAYNNANAVYKVGWWRLWLVRSCGVQDGATVVGVQKRCTWWGGGCGWCAGDVSRDECLLLDWKLT